MMLSPRERFNRIMSFLPVDRLPIWGVEEVTEGAVRKWISQGKFPIGKKVDDVFPLDPVQIIRLDTGPLPAFVSRTIEDSENWSIYIDEYGFTVKVLKEQSISPRVYIYVAGSISNWNEWNSLKSRYDAKDPRRKPRNWSPDLIDYYNKVDSPVGMRIDWGPGRGPKNGYTLGFDLFLQKLVEEPDLIKDMFDFWADFVIDLMYDYVTNCKIDFAYFAEDGIAYKNSSLVSPKMYKDLWIPAMRKVTDFLYSHNIKIIGHYSSGDQRPLIPILLDIGVNLYFPLEVAAGMNAIELRKRFGRDILLIGNISRQALMDGPLAIEKEFYAKVPNLTKHGGYIPAVDDAILPDISYESYKYYLDLVREFKP